MAEINLSGIDGIIYSLRTLFRGFGYNEYKMTKFEEYDLYVKNKGFLISDNVITFTDTNGKLLALKPDVTMSIVKNTKTEDGIKKVFYNENVYRVSSSDGGYKEISQIGLECIGEIDDYSTIEILTLAAESLKIISKDSVLCLSPIGLVSGYIDALCLISPIKASVYKCINEKNLHELKSILEEANVSKDDILKLMTALDVYGDVDTSIAKLKDIFKEEQLYKIVKDLEDMLRLLPDEVKKIINIDCSSCENVKYYNAITFKGYIDGLPKEILSGGRYDGLLKKMGKNCKAIGFAIYPDEFDRMFCVKNQYDVDTVVLYTEKSDKTAVLNAVKQLAEKGLTAMAVKDIPVKLKYKNKIII